MLLNISVGQAIANDAETLISMQQNHTLTASMNYLTYPTMIRVDGLLYRHSINLRDEGQAWEPLRDESLPAVGGGCAHSCDGL
ncbi:hypothetical protein FSST1_008705 [Fusarium sambucinum]